MILFNLHTKVVIKMMAKTTNLLISLFIMKLCPDSVLFHAYALTLLHFMHLLSLPLSLLSLLPIITILIV